MTITGRARPTTTISGDGKNLRILDVSEHRNGQARISHLRMTFASATNSGTTRSAGSSSWRSGGSLISITPASTAATAGAAGDRRARQHRDITNRDRHATWPQESTAFLNLGVPGVVSASQVSPYRPADCCMNRLDGREGRGRRRGRDRVDRQHREHGQISARRSGYNTGLDRGTGIVTRAGTMSPSPARSSPRTGREPDTGGQLRRQITNGGGNVETLKTASLSQVSDPDVYNAGQQLGFATRSPRRWSTARAPIPSTSVAVSLAAACPTGSDQRRILASAGRALRRGRATRSTSPSRRRLPRRARRRGDRSTASFTFSAHASPE